MFKRHFCAALLGLTATGAVHADAPAETYTYLNELRGRADLVDYGYNAELAQAAQNHADYLAQNNTTGHYESAGGNGYTGYAPSDRTAYAGYRSLSVTENVSYGEDDGYESVDDLMSAIYHRFGFLDFARDEVGSGVGTYASGSKSYVYNMGTAALNTLCSGSSYSGYGSYYYSVCNPDIHVQVSAYDGALDQVRAGNPELVFWPVEDGTDIPPVFYEESPDPLPDYSVSGYPVSIQFNPYYVGSAGLTDLRLYRDADGTEVTPTRLLDQYTDPNGRLDGYEYVLFPLERLDWNTAYRVEASYVVDGAPVTRSWRFTTRDLGVTVHTVTGAGETVSVGSGITAAIYVPPTDAYTTVGSISYSYGSGIQDVAIDWVDQNTFKLTVTGTVGKTVSFTLSGGRSFTAQVSEDVQPVNQAPTVNAGDDQAVDSLATVTLQGTASDSDGSVVAYAWTQLSGTAVSLSGTDSATASFTAPEVSSATNLVFRFAATDDDGASASDTVTVLVNPTASDLVCDLNGDGRIKIGRAHV